MKTMTTYAIEKWTLSKGQNTYGYNICTIKDTKTGKKGQCNGGGYDMAGTSLAGLLVELELNKHLLKIVGKTNCNYIHDATNGTFINNEPGGHTYESPIFYGTYYQIDKKGNHSVTVDGATGMSNVIDLYGLAGVTITLTHDETKRRQRTGYFISVG